MSIVENLARHLSLYAINTGAAKKLTVVNMLVAQTIIRPSSRSLPGPQAVGHVVLENQKPGGRHPRDYPQTFYATPVEPIGASMRT